MAKEVKVLVACGSGVATSTVAQEAVKKIAEEAKINIKITKVSLGEITDKEKDVDVILTTANYRKPLSKPYMSVFGLISGVNEAKVKSDLIALLQKIANEN